MGSLELDIRGLEAVVAVFGVLVGELEGFVGGLKRGEFQFELFRLLYKEIDGNVSRGKGKEAVEKETRRHTDSRSTRRASNLSLRSLSPRTSLDLL